MPSILLERRPDVRFAEEQLRAANAQIGVAKSLYFPSISLSGLFGVASGDLSKLFESNSTGLGRERRRVPADLPLGRDPGRSQGGGRHPEAGVVQLRPGGA